MKVAGRILEVSRELFFKFGIKRVTVDDIASLAGISKKTLYQEFKDKNKIVLKLVKDYLHEHECVFSKMCKSSDDPVQEVVSMMPQMGKVFSTVNPNFYYDLQKYHPDAWESFRKFKSNFILGMVEGNLERGIKSGLYRKEINPVILSRMRIEQVEWALNPAVFPSEKTEIHKVQVCLLDHFLYGLLTDKGRQVYASYKKLLKIKH